MTMRSVDTRFWADTWVRKLNALDRYLFLYLLTNDKTNWCGIYELDISMMAFESGIDERDLERSLLPRLMPKVIYVDGWVYIENFSKYHLNGSESTEKGYKKALAAVPEKIRLRIKEMQEEGVGMGGTPSFAFASALALTRPSLRSGVVYEEEIIEEDTRVKRKPKYPHSKEVFGWFPRPQKAWAINTTELKHAELLYERGEKQVRAALRVYEENSDNSYCPDVSKPSYLEQKWPNLLKFSKKHV